MKYVNFGHYNRHADTANKSKSSHLADATNSIEN